MKVLLHIGDGKCGSTAIQNYLFHSKSWLANQGVLYETGPGRRDHFLFATLLGRSTRLGSGQQSERAQRALTELKNKAKEYRVVVISAESLFLIPPQEVIALLDGLIRGPQDIEVIGYVRPPVNMYRSLIQQELKGQKNFTKPDIYSRPLDRVLRSWIKVVGRPRVHFRSFDRKTLQGGDAVTDFMTLLGELGDITLPSRIDGGDHNTSLSSEQLIVLQKVRECIPQDLDGKFHPISQAALAAFDILNEKELFGTPIKLNADAISALEVRNTEIVQRANILVPSLGLEFGAPRETRAFRAPWNETPSVSAILASHDDSVVGELWMSLARDCANDDLACIANQVMASRTSK